MSTSRALFWGVRMNSNGHVARFRTLRRCITTTNSACWSTTRKYVTSWSNHKKDAAYQTASIWARKAHAYCSSGTFHQRYSKLAIWYSSLPRLIPKWALSVHTSSRQSCRAGTSHLLIRLGRELLGLSRPSTLRLRTCSMSGCEACRRAFRRELAFFSTKKSSSTRNKYVSIQRTSNIHSVLKRNAKKCSYSTRIKKFLSLTNSKNKNASKKT